MENSQQIEAILNSIQSIQKAAAPPFFSSKVMHQLFAPADVLGWQLWLIFRPAAIAATLGVFFSAELLDNFFRTHFGSANNCGH